MLLFAAWLVLLLTWGVLSSGCALTRPPDCMFPKFLGLSPDGGYKIWLCAEKVRPPPFRR